MKRRLTCTNYFIILEKKDFQESTPKNPNANVWARPVPPPPPPMFGLAHKVTTLAPKLSRTFMEIGNQKDNHKLETNSELIYENRSISSTLIFIKIIGSDTL